MTLYPYHSNLLYQRVNRTYAKRGLQEICGEVWGATVGAQATGFVTELSLDPTESPQTQIM
jgi:hypothetical protein